MKASDEAPDSTAARVALWRALHVAIDPPPHVLADEVGLRLLAPGPDWRQRGDMDPQFTRPFRAAIVARARFIEDLVVEQAGRGVGQYVILGAGLDSFAQRRPDIASRLGIFEIDRPGPQAWKRRRLVELGFGVPDWLRFVPVDFEAGGSWLDGLRLAGFDEAKPAIVASTGVSMYLTSEANAATLHQVGSLASGSIFAMTFLVPLELAGPDVRPGPRNGGEWRAGQRHAVSQLLHTPADMLALAREAGFAAAEHVSGDDLAGRYFTGRRDGLRPSSNAEELAGGERRLKRS